MGLFISVSVIQADDLKKVEKLARECASGKQKSCRELAQIARTQWDFAMREAAIKKLSDQPVLAEIATTAPNSSPDLGAGKTPPPDISSSNF